MNKVIFLATFILSFSVTVSCFASPSVPAGKEEIRLAAVALAQEVASEKAATAEVKEQKAAPSQESSKSLQSIEVLTGFTWGSLLRQQHFHAYPLAVSFDFDLKTFLNRKLKFTFVPLLQFQVEPYLSYISAPKNNFEGGTMLFIKFGLFPETWKFQPYFKAGAGALYMTLHTKEQSTQFNFSEAAGYGMHFFISPKLALTTEYRYRHVSNSGCGDRNHGFNNHLGFLGVAYKF